MSHPVYLHVYGSAINRYLRWLGFSFCLSSVEVHGMEHLFRPHDDHGREDRTGIVSGDSLHPIVCLASQNRFDSILIGYTELERVDMLHRIIELQSIYTAVSYHPITNNSHHFADSLCRYFTGNPIPLWLNRAAAIGTWLWCRCLIDEEFKAEMPQAAAAPNVSPDHDDGDGDDHDGGDGGEGNNGNKSSRSLSW